MKEPTVLEKLPVYVVAWSLSLCFAIMATIALGFYPYGDVCVAVLKAKFMVIAVLGGTVLSVGTLFVRKFKRNEETRLIVLIRIVLMPLAYFTFYFGMNKFLVTGICLAGIPVGILSAQGMMRNRTTDSTVPSEGAPPDVQ